MKTIIFTLAIFAVVAAQDDQSLGLGNNQLGNSGACIGDHFKDEVLSRLDSLKDRIVNLSEQSEKIGQIQDEFRKMKNSLTIFKDKVHSLVGVEPTNSNDFSSNLGIQSRGGELGLGAQTRLNNRVGLQGREPFRASAGFQSDGISSPSRSYNQYGQGQAPFEGSFGLGGQPLKVNGKVKGPGLQLPSVDFDANFNGPSVSY